jgi:hypothetical protein
MRVRHVTVRLVAGAQPMEAAMEAAIEDGWQQLGLPSSPSTTFSYDADARLADVHVDGRLLAVSGRARHEIAVAATGEPRALDEPAGAEAFVNLRFAGASGEQRETLLCELVRASLRSALAQLVAADADEIAHRWSRAGAAVELVRLTGRLGIAPSQLRADAVREVIASGDDDPLVACDALVDQLGRTDALTPVLELSRATLRRLTLSQTPLRPELLNLSGRPPAAPRNLRADIAKGYGVELPNLRLAIAADVADDRFRVRFGPVRSQLRLVPPDGVYAIEATPGTRVGEDASAVVLDPVYGHWWPISSQKADPSWVARFHDCAALVVRGLAAELERRRAWWAPRSPEELGEPWYMAEPLYGQLRRRLPAVLRWLSASGATVNQGSTVVEGMVAALADGEDSVAAMVRSAREMLRGAALGPVLHDCAVTPVALDPAAVRAALEAEDAGPLLASVPELLDSVGMTVLECGAEERPRVEELLLGLDDTVRVASEHELRGAAFAAPAAV